MNNRHYLCSKTTERECQEQNVDLCMTFDDLTNDLKQPVVMGFVNGEVWQSSQVHGSGATIT